MLSAVTAPLKTTRLSTGTTLLVVFVLVSAGPFGVEEMVATSRPRRRLPNYRLRVGAMA